MINPQRVDPVSLRLFVSTLDLGSLTAGAQRCAISLPAASKRIADLEQHFQLPLIVRSRRGVVPTAAGQTLYQHALEVLARMEQLMLSMQDFESGGTGQLRLWANATAFAGLLPEILAPYSRLHPGITLDVKDVLIEEAVAAVATGVAEVAIIGENTHVGELQTLTCDEDELVAILPPSHVLQSHDLLELEDLLDHDMVSLPRSSSLTRLIISHAETFNKHLRIRIQVRSFEGMCQMVAAGLGLALAPRKVAESRAMAMQLLIRPLSAADMRRRLVMAVRSQAQLSRPAKAFVDLALRRYQVQK
jgi:DNA-binding transcriptional LysR family regulator